MFKKFLSGYFSFSKKERRGILFLLGAILLFTLFPFFFPFLFKGRVPDHRAFEKDIARLKLLENDSNDRRRQSYPGKNYYRSFPDNKVNKNVYPLKPEVTLFNFDPNTLDAGGWKKLGIRERTISTIHHYLEKGGKFGRPEDIAKIWGLHEEEVQRLLPFVTIPDATVTVHRESKKKDPAPDLPVKYSFRRVDINKGDTNDFIALPGIGSRLASRIVKFRDKLGGFNTPDQVAETYALPDTTFRKIRPMLVLNDPAVKRININTAGVEELKAHPYIRYSLANAIVQFREQHGKFSAIKDIKNIMTMTEDLYNKLSPYLSVE